MTIRRRHRRVTRVLRSVVASEGSDVFLYLDFPSGR